MDKLIEFGIDDYSTYREIAVYGGCNNVGLVNNVGFGYGPDGNLYSFGLNGEINVINIENGISSVRNVVDDLVIWNNSPYLVSSWLSVDPCGHIPCDSIDKIGFDNAQVCYGEPLMIDVPDAGPYSITYSINSLQDTTINDISSSWRMPQRTGEYLIKKITAKGCEFYPKSRNTAKIGEKKHPLTIKSIVPSETP